MAAKLKRGDRVIVLSGNDKGREGVINSIDRKTGRAIVEGVNVRVRHRKPDQGNPGGRVAVTAPVQLSNLAYRDPASGEATRVGFRFEDGKKVRFAKKSGETIDG